MFAVRFGSRYGHSYLTQRTFAWARCGQFPYDNSIAEVCNLIANGVIQVFFHETQQRFEQRFPWVGILGDEH